MRVNVIPITELSDEDKQKWLNIQASNPNILGPCFHPDLYLSVSEFIPNIYVALLYEGNSLVGFLPYLKDEEQSTARIIEFCDYQAIIGSTSHKWDMNDIFKKVGLKTWQFRALTNFENIKLDKKSSEKMESVLVDLTDGFEKYLEDQKQKHKKSGFKEILYKQRLIERKIGPIRYVSDCKDKEVLNSMLRWKIDRHNRDADWIKLATGMLDRIFYLKNSTLSGVLSALYAGDALIGATFCIRSQGIMQGWINSFNPEFSKYSPGLLLVYYQIAELQTLNCNILDFGPGKGQYKWDFANSSRQFIRGSFATNSLKENIKSINWLYKRLKPIVRKINRISNR
ncbi:GNAT family N-acetyltransferase [Candidatus Omnitrophota bacterium]